MKAVVYKSPNTVAVEEVANPQIQDATDAILRLTTAGICGSDLHMYEGRAPVEPGLIFGHENMGVIEKVGSAVTSVKVGDRVVLPFNIGCGFCFNCTRGFSNACLTVNPQSHGGGYGYSGMGPHPGGQAEFVRVPFADATLVRIPDVIRDDPAKRVAVLALTDVMGTGFHGVKSAGLVAGGDVVIVGDGAVGLCAVIAARYLGAERIVSVGHHPGRLALAAQFGATHTVDSHDADASARISEITGGGAGSVVEAVGVQSTLDLALEAVRDGGTVSFVGVPAGMDSLNFRRLFAGNVALRGALAPVRAYLPELMGALEAGRIDPSPVFTARLPLGGAPDGYRAMDERETIKVCLEVSSP